MKKFLSLVLTLAMALTLVTVSAGATDFEDDSDISYQEAVTVIAGIGVVDGYTDGTFRPDEVLTRGAAAKIICNLILGPTTASVLSASSAPFVDVPTTNTFAGYITYCAQQGIINGYADGTFRPTGTLTGNAFMKMLLGALGYDSSIEVYTGANWNVSVLKQAVGIGLTDGNDDFLGSQAVTRGEACLYAYNMLQATMVEYSSTSTIVVGDVTVSTASSRSDVTNTTKTDGNIDDDGLMQFAEKYFTKLVAEDDTDSFGRPATTWTYSGTELGTYANDADATYVLSSSTDSLLTMMTDGDCLGYATKDILGDAEVYVNGTDMGTYTANKAVETLGSKGDILEVYEDSDGDVETIVFRSYTYAKIDDVNTSLSSTYTNRGASVGIDLVDINGTSMGTFYDAYNDDSKVLVGYNSSYTEDTVLAVALGDSGEVLDSYIMEYVTGTPSAATAVSYVTGQSVVKSGNITIDGTKYTYAGQMTGLGDDENVDFDQMYTVYLTAEGYVLAVDGDSLAALDDVYYVAGVYSSTSSGRTTYYIETVSMKDGTLASLPLSSDGADQFAVTSINYTSGTTYSTEVAGLYVLDSSSGKYFIDEDYIEEADDTDSYDTIYEDGMLKDGQKVGSYTLVVASKLSQSVTSDSATIRFTDSSKGRLYLTDDSFFVSVDGDAAKEDLTVKTATGVMSMSENSTFSNIFAFYKTNSGDDNAVFVMYVGEDLLGAASKSDLVYLTGDATTATKDGYLGDVFFLSTMTQEDDLVLEDNYDQGFYLYSVDDDDIYELDNSSSSLKEYKLSTGEVGTSSNSDGLAIDVIFTAAHSSRATGSTFAGNDDTAAGATDEGGIDFIAISFASATVIDTRSSSSKSASLYSGDITSASTLAAALNRGTVTADVYVEDGAIVFVAVTGTQKATVEEDTDTNTGSSSVTGSITVNVSKDSGAAFTASDVATSIDSNGDLTIAVPLYYNDTYKLTSTDALTVAIDGIYYTTGTGSDANDKQMVWTLSGKNLSSSNAVVVTISKCAYVNTDASITKVSAAVGSASTETIASANATISDATITVTYTLAENVESLSGSETIEVTLTLPAGATASDGTNNEDGTATVTLTYSDGSWSPASVTVTAEDGDTSVTYTVSVVVADAD